MTYSKDPWPDSEEEPLQAQNEEPQVGRNSPTLIAAAQQLIPSHGTSDKPNAFCYPYLWGLNLDGTSTTMLLEDGWRRRHPSDG